MKASRRRALSFDEAAAVAGALRADGRTIVFTNGVFDLLHAGHVQYLQAARALGDALVVGLNADESVRRVKGAGRPVTPDADRAELLLALACVEAVVLFGDDTPLRLISRIQPDVLVKGADWGLDAIVGRDVVEARGGRVVRIDLLRGYSTTEIIRRVRAAAGLRRM